MTAPNMSKFSTKPKPAAAGAPKSRWGAGRPKDAKNEMPFEGAYRFRVVSLEDRRHPKSGRESVITTLEIMGLDERAALHHKQGDFVIMLNFKTSAGIDELKRFCIAAAGYDDPDAYGEGCDPEFEFALLDASLGLHTALPEGWTLVGRVVDALVERGKDTEDGGFFRRYTFAAVADEEQDVTPRPSLG
jgi:hypothetical protein